MSPLHSFRDLRTRLSALSTTNYENSDTNTTQQDEIEDDDDSPFIHRVRPSIQDEDEDKDPADEIIVDSDFTLPAARRTSAASQKHSSVASNKTKHHQSFPQIEIHEIIPQSNDTTTLTTNTTTNKKTWREKAQKYKLWRSIDHYFDPSFPDKTLESRFRKKMWTVRKRLAVMAALFIFFTWALGVAFIPRPWTTYNYYCYIGIIGFFSIGLPIIAFLDFPERHHLIWQIFLLCTVWSFPVIFIIEMYTCGYYRRPPNTGYGGGACGNKDFASMLYYAAAYPTLAIFSLRQTRFWALLSCLGYCACLAVMILPYRITWIRNFFVFLTFNLFIIVMSYSKEMIERKSFLISDQLKAQYRATQRAQDLEHKAADSKKRFVSYIFHEVRVPLNAALLSMQNLAAEGVFSHCDNSQKEIVDALSGSLGMMGKVLNDVLDFNRMEEGKFVCTNDPLDFHKVVRSLLVSARVVAENRGISLESDLDEMVEKLKEEKVMTGDQMRLRQVLSNLISNACKFTNAGGRVKVTTRLLHPTDQKHLVVPRDARMSRRTSDNDSHVIDIACPEPFDNPDVAIVRMEVQDTGVGIRRSDLINNRLFSPYVQTEEGRRQGGKGTGLGLALVRHIVKLSGGRLGVQSQVGVGSTFWVELPLGLQDKHPEHVAENGTNAVADVKTKKEEMNQGRVKMSEDLMGEPYLPALAGMRGFSEKIRSATNDSLGREAARGAIGVSTSTGANADVKVVNAQSVETPPADGVGVIAPPNNDGRAGLHEGLSEAMAPAVHAKDSIEPGNICPLCKSIRPHPDTSLPTPPSDDQPPPVTSTTAKPTPTAPNPTSPTTTALTLHILVVDDDKITRLLMSRILKRLGHTVTTAEDGSIALSLLLSQKSSFDLVFLDNQMPVMTGVECIQKMRENDLRVWACGITGNAMREDQDEFLTAGIDRILTKPVQEKDLREMIDLVLSQPRSEWRDRDMRQGGGEGT